MSTKIYNGYIFNKKIKTLDQAHKYLRLVRSKFEDSGKKKINQVAVNIAQYFYDSLENNVLNDYHKNIIDKLKDNQYQDNLLSQIINQTEQEFREDAKSPYKSGIYDLNCSVSLYQYQNRVLVLFFGSKSFEKIFNKLPMIEDFHYQDQTDEPENILRKDFKLRGKWWDKVLQDKTPVQSGLSFSLMTDYESIFLSPKYKDIVDSLGKNIESRTDTIVRDLALKEMPFPKTERTPSFSELMDHFKTEHFTEVEDRLKKKIKLKTNFSIDDFKKDKILSKVDKISK